MRQSNLIHFLNLTGYILNYCINIMKMWLLILLTISHTALAEILLYFPGEPRPLDTFTSMPSLFGTTIPTTGLVARITYASPADGCQLIQPPLDRNMSQTWVALIARNNCSFELKVRNAQASNYDGVIIHNVGSDDLLEMFVENTTDIQIPSVFIGETDGFDLRRIFSLHDLYYIIITPDYPFNYSDLLVVITGIMIIVLFVIILAKVLKCATHHYRRSRQLQIVCSINKLITEHKHGGRIPYKELEVCADINTEEYMKGHQHA